MNPAFELDQIQRYIDHPKGDPRQLASTAKSNFFPVLQRIFFREVFEVRTEQRLAGRAYPFKVSAHFGTRGRQPLEVAGKGRDADRL